MVSGNVLQSVLTATEVLPASLMGIQIHNSLLAYVASKDIGIYFIISLI